MNTRIKELRKSLKLTQKEFGDVLGISHAGVSKIENGTVALTDRNINTLVKYYNVNELWLREGVGDMFNNLRKNIFDELVDEYKLDDLSQELLRAFLALDLEKRKWILEWLKDTLSEQKKDEL